MTAQSKGKDREAAQVTEKIGQAQHELSVLTRKSNGNDADRM